MCCAVRPAVNKSSRLKQLDSLIKLKHTVLQKDTEGQVFLCNGLFTVIISSWCLHEIEVLAHHGS